MTELKTCPFCGGEAQLVFEEGSFDWASDLNYVKCTKCGARGAVWHSNLVDESVKAQQAIKSWNNRIET